MKHIEDVENDTMARVTDHVTGAIDAYGLARQSRVSVMTAHRHLLACAANGKMHPLGEAPVTSANPLAERFAR